MSIQDDINEIFALRDHGDIHARDLFHYIVIERGWNRDAYNRAKKEMGLQGTRRGEQYWYHSPKTSDISHLMVAQIREWVRKTDSWEELITELKKALKEVKKNPYPPKARYMYGREVYSHEGMKTPTRKRRFS